MAQVKGNFVIKHVPGIATIAGLAFPNSTNSAGLTDSTQIQTLNDSLGQPATETKDYDEFTMDLDIMPGVGGGFDKTQLTNAFALKLKGALISTTGFPGPVSDNVTQTLNWPATHFGQIMECKLSTSNGGNGTFSITARKILLTSSTGTKTWKDFTTNDWTPLA